MLLGFLTFKSRYVPKLFGLLLLLAGISYVVDYFSRFLFPEAHLPVSTYLGWGEPIFMIWLLVAGVLLEAVLLELTLVDLLMLEMDVQHGFNP